MRLSLVVTDELNAQIVKRAKDKGLTKNAFLVSYLSQKFKDDDKAEEIRNSLQDELLKALSNNDTLVTLAEKLK